LKTHDTVSHTVVILCSGFGLGFYIPGLLISATLRRAGIPTSVEVFESLMSREKLQMVERNRQAYHQNFRVALASQKVPGDTRDSWDAVAMDALLSAWQRQGCRHFMCLSGHWVHVLDQYRERMGHEVIHADLLYLDAELTPSWKWLRQLKPDYAHGYREVRLYDDSIRYCVNTNSGPPLPYEQRSRRLVVHGGGWGIGTFQERIPSLEGSGYALDIVCYASTEAAVSSPTRRYLMDDPDWRTWHRDGKGELTFPPFGEIAAPSQAGSFRTQSGCHGLHAFIREALGIVSKPGAGTLIDSFAAATPLVLLEPFGPHEERNSHVWQAAGFGVPFAQWAKSGYSMSMLEELHKNLIAKRGAVKDYAEDYARSMFATSPRGT